MARAKKAPTKSVLGRDLAELGSVHVLRHEEGGARLLGIATAAELADREAFAARFGGGSYTLMARTPDNRQLAARVPLAIEGAPKPAPTVAPVRARRRRAGVDVDAGAMPFATPAGLLARAVFACFAAGRSTAEIVDELGVEPAIVRALFREWICDHTEEPPTTPEEIAARVKARRARQRERWNDELSARA
jgi:hypothetical protein